jgi:hypothetical protein
MIPINDCIVNYGLIAVAIMKGDKFIIFNRNVNGILINIKGTDKNIL